MKFLNSPQLLNSGISFIGTHLTLTSSRNVPNESGVACSTNFSLVVEDVAVNWYVCCDQLVLLKPIPEVEIVSCIAPFQLNLSIFVVMAVKGLGEVLNFTS